jgi:hypothetical protein
MTYVCLCIDIMTIAIMTLGYLLIQIRLTLKSHGNSQHNWFNKIDKLNES